MVVISVIWIGKPSLRVVVCKGAKKIKIVIGCTHMKLPRIILIIVLLIIAFLLYGAVDSTKETLSGTEQNIAVNLEAETFTGILTDFNSGCYADGECFAVVGGNHVTILRGWSQEIVGSVSGTIDGMGGLLDHIGEEVEVYAQPVAENKYTLYGSEEYYIRVSE